MLEARLEKFTAKNGVVYDIINVYLVSQGVEVKLNTYFLQDKDIALVNALMPNELHQ